MSNTLRQSEEWTNDPDDSIDVERPAKTRRIRLACLRCQKRKIKCDGSVPKCAPCQRAGAECVDGKKTGGEGSISRCEAASLQSYIQSLEDALRHRAPDLDLTSLNSARPLILPSAGEPVRGGCDNDSVPAWQGDLSRVTNRATSPRATNNEEAHIQTRARSTSVLASSSQQGNRGEIAHDIGLVPLSTGVSKYVGPSSGFTLTKLIFNSAQRNNTIGFKAQEFTAPGESPSTTIARSLLSIQPAALPSSMIQAIQLSRIYFEHVHVQYPFLHEPTFLHMLRNIYNDADSAPKWSSFQVKMVLAISASILSKRLPIPFSGESLCASAMKDMEEIDVQSSIQGLQCLLLVYMFTLHSPFSGASPWHLNYQCLAAVIDLGLQRDLAQSAEVSDFEREMRTRIFWVVYTIDRTLATTLGRPIGLRDEACELRQPANTEDGDLNNPNLTNPEPSMYSSTSRKSFMACASTLFQLAQLNSEIKYVLHSLSHTAPRYTYPQIPDITVWQNDIWERLKTCNVNAPKFTDEQRHLTIICGIRYNEVVMHLFRPTPRIRSPITTSLQACHESAEKTISLWKELYEADRMSYSWVTIHSVCLSALTILYCIWTSPDIASSTHVDVFTSTMRDASILLSAAGEYWIEARRSRGRLDGLANATVRWLTDKLRGKLGSNRLQNGQRGASQTSQPGVNANTVTSRRRNTRPTPNPRAGTAFVPDTFGVDASIPNPAQQSNFHEVSPELDFNTYISNQDLALFLGAPDVISSGNDDFLFDGMFSDYQPLFDFNGVDSGMNFKF